jgi:dTDP-4-dehydrorhamnose reductase
LYFALAGLIELLSDPQLQAATFRMISALQEETQQRQNIIKNSSSNVYLLLHDTLRSGKSCLDLCEAIAKTSQEQTQVLLEAQEYYSLVLNVAQTKLEALVTARIAQLFDPQLVKLAQLIVTQLHLKISKLQAHKMQLEDELQTYRSLGADFHKLATNLTKTRKEIQVVKDDIARLGGN